MELPGNGRYGSRSMFKLVGKSDIFLRFPVIILVCLLAACNQSAAIEVTVPTPTAQTLTATRPAPTKTPLSPTVTRTSPPPTAMPPTATAMPPTELPSSPTAVLPTATPTAETTVVLQETITSQPEDLIGSWESQRGLQIIFTQSGGARIIDSEGGEMVGVGKFHFAGEQLVLDSDVCLKYQSGFAVESPCMAFYTVYILKEEDEVVGLRFDNIEDPYRDRRNAMTGRDWGRIEE